MCSARRRRNPVVGSHGEATWAEVIRTQLGKPAWLAISVFIWLALIYVIVAFTDVTASTFVSGDKEMEGLAMRFNPGGAVAMAAILYMVLSIVLVLVERFLKPPLWLSTLIFVPATLGAVFMGTQLSTAIVLDARTWSVLIHVFPQADIPVVQLSINESKTASWHYAIARDLAPLRDEGILIMGSGNLVHNLHTYAWGSREAEPLDWALRFEELALAAMSDGEFGTLVGYESLGRDAMLSAPTPDHYLPLLYILAQRQGDEPVTFPVQGFDGGSISMLAVQLG